MSTSTSTMKPASGRLTLSSTGATPEAATTPVVTETKTTTTRMNPFTSDWVLWVYLVIAAIVLVICWWIAAVRDSVNYWKSLTMVSWAQNLWVMGILMIVALLLLAYATYRAYVASDILGDRLNVNMIMLTFALQMVLLVVAFAVLFRNHQTSTAFYFVLLLVVITAWQFYLFQRSGDRVAVWLLLLYAIWLVVALFISWNVYTSNP